MSFGFKSAKSSLMGLMMMLTMTLIPMPMMIHVMILMIKPMKAYNNDGANGYGNDNQ